MSDQAGRRWAGGLPLNEMKQQLSLGYIHMVAAAAGCHLKDHKTDYDGVDATIASSAEYETFYCPQFEIQVKCTSRSDLLADEHLAWSMGRKPFLKLTSVKRFTPAYLGVLLVPDDPSGWLDQDEERFLSRSRMYWQRAADLGTIEDGKVSKTVHLPRSNLFDVPQLLGIMETIGEGGAW